MKILLILCTGVWGAMVLEQARPDLLPTGAILLPLVIVGMLWNRTAGGVFAGGLILVIDWIARPQGLPLLPVVVTFCVVLIVISRAADDPWTGQRTRRLRIPEWMQPTVLVVIGIAVLVGPAMIDQPTSLSAVLPVIGKYAMTALPWSLLLTGLMRLAGEFGFRRLT